MQQNYANNESFSNAYLLDQGIINLCGPIDMGLSQSIVSQLHYLDHKYPGRDIQMIINSPGGSVSAGFAIYDTMNYIKSDIQTIATGLAASMAAFLVSAGTKGKRCALPNSEILIHQPLGGVDGQASDIVIAAKNIEKTKNRLNYLLSLHTGKSIEQITRDTDRDYSMMADEAQKYGLIDCILATKVKALGE